MGDLDRALRDIQAIRRQVADGTQFRGYGPATVALSAAIAVAAAVVQARTDVPYLAVWIGAACVAVVMNAAGLATRTRRMHSGMSGEMLRMAVQQFVPSLLAGVLLTAVVALRVPGLLWMLPGLWQVVFSLGIFASCRFLPKAMLAPAVWFLGTGLAALAMGGDAALRPVMMGVPFGVGQILIAGVLWLHNGEHDAMHAEEEFDDA